MRRGLTGLVGIALLLAGCQRREPVAYDTTTYPLKRVMRNVIDFGAKPVLAAQGTYVDLTGEHPNTPTTEDGWLAAESGAVTVAEAANLLKLPGYRRDDEDWPKFADVLHDRAVDAQKAIAKRDAAAISEAGAQLYQVCEDCHATYARRQAQKG
ncbi:MAG TPA: hypothetical protein VFN88_01850 [Caulobacteraceae bacterium]|nr:hypothetical protein [Caulobacteraceae bacterium]